MLIPNRYLCQSPYERDAVRLDMGALMAEMEGNYIRLRQLIPDVRALPECWVSREVEGLHLRVRVIERSPYTSTLHLTYEIDLEGGKHLAPDLQVRIYHDARLAEVLVFGDRCNPRAGHYDNTRGRRTLVEQWRANRFLHKWLGYCLRQGHRCDPEDIDLAPDLA